MTVMASLMHRALQIAGAAWAEKQDRESANGRSRSYRLLEAAFANDLKDYFCGMCRVLLPLPRGIPLAAMTLKLKAMMFRVASRAMCSMHALLRTARRMHPYLLFRTLVTGEYDESPPCMWDALATFFRAEFPEFSEEARASLEGLAEIVDKCISSIEARHALSRRLTVSRGVQTWTPKLAAASAEFCIRQVGVSKKPGPWPS